MRRKLVDGDGLRGARHGQRDLVREVQFDFGEWQGDTVLLERMPYFEFNIAGNHGPEHRATQPDIKLESRDIVTILEQKD